MSLENKDTSDNWLEINTLKLIPRIKAKYNHCLSNMEGMTKGEKIKYFIYFYRGAIIVLVLVLLLLITVPMYIIKANKPIAISYAVINQDPFYPASEDGINGYMEHFGYDDHYKSRSYSGIQLSATDTDATATDSTNTNDGSDLYLTYQDESNAGYVQFPLLCRDGSLDFVLMDKVALEYCEKSDLFLSLEDALSTEGYKQLLEKYPELEIINIKDPQGNSILCVINISHTEFAKSFDLSYDEVYMVFPKTKDASNKKPKELIEYIFGISY